MQMEDNNEHTDKDFDIYSQLRKTDKPSFKLIANT